VCFVPAGEKTPLATAREKNWEKLLGSHSGFAEDSDLLSDAL
jgi:hypothetical protein